MGEMMDFPKKPMDFIKMYSFCDKEEVYTNGAELIPAFRVKQLVDHYVPRWIPVTERLPEDAEEIVLVIVSGIVQGIGFDDMLDLATFDPAEGWCLEAYPDAQITVTHWMPLPEPPEVEG